MSIDLKNLSKSELNDLIKSAERRKNELVSENVQRVRDNIAKLLSSEGLSFEQVYGGRQGGKEKVVKYKVRPKYCNPDNPTQKWSGRGLKPRWFAAALAAGKQEKDLLIA
ncbi:MAG: histidine biosynthesis protein [Lysobacterales bacterium CG02_land_8_20_14_3_00_62_12]|nr:MAG: histidine biosynthesis protein [Xanthomonadales bacterium CG02_land_8_20_14_3_00_62_12]PJA42123.1 MAG: histidine biosynthesis protein [Xanthomonadales bacterium CG_4_9_14_3_um_filter_62_6]